MDHEPRFGLPAKTKRRDRLIRRAETPSDWVVGFADEVGWRRVAPPALRGGPAAERPLRIVEHGCPQDDPTPNALAWYGRLARMRTSPAAPPVDQLRLRFVDGRPVRAGSSAFLQWGSERLPAAGKTALLLIWDNASWPISKAVRPWLREHKRQVKDGRRTGVRIVLCLLPSTSPWLNAIEPTWLHGKRAVVEPDRLRSTSELADRTWAYYGCAPEPHLVQPQKAA